MSEQRDDARCLALLSLLDEFLRSDPAVLHALTEFLRHRGIPHPGFAAHNLIDEISFTTWRP